MRLRSVQLFAICCIGLGGLANAGYSVSTASMSGSTLTVIGSGAQSSVNITVNSLTIGKSNSSGSFNLSKANYVPPSNCSVSISDGKDTARKTLANCTPTTSPTPTPAPTPTPTPSPAPAPSPTPVSGTGPVANTSFSISSASQSSSSVAAGQSLSLRLNVKSTSAATNVHVYALVMHSGSPDVRLEIRNLNFSAGESKSLSFNYVARSTDRIGTKYWAAEVYQNSNMRAQAYTQRGGVNMSFQQSSGVDIFAPFGSEFDNLCDQESVYMYVPCSLGSILLNLEALYVNDYFADSYRVTALQVEAFRSWNGSSAVVSDNATNKNVTSAIAIDTQLGDERTKAIINDANVATDSAADYCNDLVHSGFSDWHLPNRSELALMFCRSTQSKSTSFPQEMPGCSTYSNYGYGGGGPGTNFYGNPNGVPFSSAVYASSTEYDANRVWAVNFLTGESIVISKSSPAQVRCIRKPYGIK